jgi:hypothetical protein
MNRHSEEEELEHALRARASLAGEAAGGADEFIGGGMGTGYVLSADADYGRDLEDDEVDGSTSDDESTDDETSADEESAPA